MLLDAALRYADDGWPVFPVHYVKNGRCSCGRACMSPGKHPATPHGFHDATTDPRKIDLWWRQNPDYNIGVATGRQSGIWVLDIDSKRSVAVGDGMLVPEGENSLREIEQTLGISIPETKTQYTGGGGQHLIFKYPQDSEEDDGNRTGFLPSVDVRGEGGYILVAPSVHPSGSRYTWADDSASIAPIPQPLLQVYRSGLAHTGMGGGWVRREAVPEGGRNDYLYKYACKLRGEGRDHNDILVLVLGRNQLECSPPLELAEVIQIVASAMRHDPNEEARFEWEPEGPGERGPSEDTDIPVLDDGDLATFSIAELMADPPPPKRALVHGGLIDFGDGAILGGPPNVGKSWMAWDLALSVASGTPFLGRFPTTQTTVLIVDEEGSKASMHDRMAKLMEAKGVLPPDNIRVSMQRGIQLDSEKGITIVRRLVERYRPGLVIFDSLTRFHTGEENSAKDMSRFFAISTKLKNAYGCAIVFLHHVRKNGKDEVDVADLMRGSTDIRGWPDTVLIALESKEPMAQGLTLHHAKSRDHEKLPNMEVSLRIGASSAEVVITDDTWEKIRDKVEPQQQEIDLDA